MFAELASHRAPPRSGFGFSSIDAGSASRKLGSSADRRSACLEQQEALALSLACWPCPLFLLLLAVCCVAGTAISLLAQHFLSSLASTLVCVAARSSTCLAHAALTRMFSTVAECWRKTASRASRHAGFPMMSPRQTKSGRSRRQPARHRKPRGNFFRRRVCAVVSGVLGRMTSRCPQL